MLLIPCFCFLLSVNFVFLRMFVNYDNVESLKFYDGLKLCSCRHLQWLVGGLVYCLSKTLCCSMRKDSKPGMMHFFSFFVNYAQLNIKLLLISFSSKTSKHMLKFYHLLQLRGKLLRKFPTFIWIHLNRSFFLCDWFGKSSRSLMNLYLQQAYDLFLILFTKGIEKGKGLFGYKP